MIAPLPVLAGAVQLTVADWLPAVAVTPVGASGGVGELDIELVPSELVHVPAYTPVNPVPIPFCPEYTVP